jgi:hypothetical protein
MINRLVNHLRSNIRQHLPKPIQYWLSAQMSNWAIGIYVGSNPLDLKPALSIKQPVISREDISDRHASLVADPFMIKNQETWYMFFEVMNQEFNLGEIGLATSNNGLEWQYQQIVLTESFHLSYPYIFQWEGDYYMIPETGEAQSIRLYKATQFPLQWNFIGNLLEGLEFLDASIVFYNNLWWLFTETSPKDQNDTLRLYYSTNLQGKWQEHPLSPIIQHNPHIARPAGRILNLGDRLIRYTQDCFPTYGTQVRAFEITDISPETYTEKQVGSEPLLTASGKGWNKSGMHHIDGHQLNDGSWIACVDGRWDYR